MNKIREKCLINIIKSNTNNGSIAEHINKIGKFDLWIHGYTRYNAI